MSQSNSTLAAQLQAELDQFTGDSDRYRHPLNPRVIFTPGVKHLAERAGAFWLIDAIASHLGSKPFVEAALRDPRVAEMHFWRLTVEADRSALLIAEADSGLAPFISQAIPFTDFPLAEISIWAANDGRHWTIYLPSEH